MKRSDDANFSTGNGKLEQLEIFTVNVHVRYLVVMMIEKNKILEVAGKKWSGLNTAKLTHSYLVLESMLCCWGGRRKVTSSIPL